MKTRSIVVELSFALGAAVYGQPPDAFTTQVLSTHAGTARDLQELVTVVRIMADMPGVSADPDQKTLVLQGTAGQIELAQWLVGEVDRPASRPEVNPEAQDPSRHEHAVPGGNELVRVFHLKHLMESRDLQEMAMLFRVTAGVEKLFTNTSSHSLVARGTPERIQGCEWLVGELDKPGGPRAPLPAAHRTPDTRENTARIFYLEDGATARDLQEISMVMRVISALKSVFTLTSRNALVLRGTPAWIALAEWLFTELEPGSTSPVSNEYRMPDAADELVRVFHVAGDAGHNLEDAAVLIRDKGRAHNGFYYHRRRALVVRGTAAQIGLADQLLKEWQNQPARPAQVKP